MLRIATLATGPVLTTAFGTDWPLRQAPQLRGHWVTGSATEQGHLFESLGLVVGFEMGDDIIPSYCIYIHITYTYIYIYRDYFISQSNDF